MYDFYWFEFVIEYYLIIMLFVCFNLFIDIMIDIKDEDFKYSVNSGNIGILRYID